MRRQCKGARELLVWDTVGQWTREREVAPLKNLGEARNWIEANAPGRAGYCGYIDRNHFEVFCKLAWVWMRAKRGRVLVIEELADVTSPSKAPNAWGEIVRKGRHEGGSIYALTQRPAESDKTIAGNADVIHTGRLSFPRDRKSLAEYLDVPESAITALPSLHWIERDMRTRDLRTGILKF